MKKNIRRKLKARPKTSHKGDFGRVFILAGSKGLAGAAHLAAMGALRSGAGLVTLGVPEKVYTVLARREAEVMVKPFTSTPQGTLALQSFRAIDRFSGNQDVIAFGPGLSTQSSTQKLILKMIAAFKQPLVIDADGLNALKGHLDVLKKAGRRAILTPHPGEFKRLFGGRLSDKTLERKKRANQVAKKYGIYLVLKGHQTVVAAPDGQVYVNSTGNPGMATGGSGDVLTGVIAALIGQKFSLWDAACFGVYLHGLAGDLAARKIGQVSLVAGDILDYLPEAIRSCNLSKIE
ncbi:MAG: NAD(P)H-hydrate dehydratase [Candidatus Omnitrophica bacterium]|nr:NAD(P)H-hydrate dehydratase [Candidatus Omnitrophota bacterium]